MSNLYEQLQNRAGLTGTEARVALALYQGMTLARYAEHKGVSVNTTRQQLKSIHTKLGTHSVGELLAWVRNLEGLGMSDPPQHRWTNTGDLLVPEGGGYAMDGRSLVMDVIVDGGPLLVQLQSWNANWRKGSIPGGHPELEQFVGRRVRVTIETIGEDE